MEALLLLVSAMAQSSSAGVASDAVKDSLPVTDVDRIAILWHIYMLAHSHTRTRIIQVEHERVNLLPLQFTLSSSLHMRRLIMWQDGAALSWARVHLQLPICALFFGLFLFLLDLFSSKCCSRKRWKFRSEG